MMMNMMMMTMMMMMSRGHRWTLWKDGCTAVYYADDDYEDDDDFEEFDDNDDDNDYDNHNDNYHDYDNDNRWTHWARMAAQLSTMLYLAAILRSSLSLL